MKFVSAGLHCTERRLPKKAHGAQYQTAACQQSHRRLAPGREDVMRTHSEAALLPVIGRLYDSAVGSDIPWQGIAADIATAFGSSSAVLKTHRPDGSVELTDTTANLAVPERDTALAQHWHQNDLWVDRSMAYGNGRIVTSEDLVPGPEFERSGFFQDWLRPLEIYHMVGTVFDADDGATCVLGIHRPKSAGPYTRNDRRQVALLMSHLQRALQLRRVVERGHLALGTISQVLATKRDCVMVTDQNGQLLFCSPAAEALLADRQVLNVLRGRVVARDTRTQSVLIHAIRQAVDLSQGKGASHPPSPTIALTRPGRLPMAVVVSPLSGNTQADEISSVPAALLVVHDPDWPDRNDPLTQTFQAVFGLTPREADLASEMFKGKLLRDAAQALGISEGHARQRLKQVFQKTGTTHQSALVALLARYV